MSQAKKPRLRGKEWWDHYFDVEAKRRSMPFQKFSVGITKDRRVRFKKFDEQTTMFTVDARDKTEARRLALERFDKESDWSRSVNRKSGIAMDRNEILSVDRAKIAYDQESETIKIFYNGMTFEMDDLVARVLSCQIIEATDGMILEESGAVWKNQALWPEVDWEKRMRAK